MLLAMGAMLALAAASFGGVQAWSELVLLAAAAMLSVESFRASAQTAASSDIDRLKPPLAPFCKDDWNSYLGSTSRNKAFAVTTDAHTWGTSGYGRSCGWFRGQPTPDDAIRKAINFCETRTRKKCVIFAVNDEIAFGLKPGGELPVESTICHEVRQKRELVVLIKPTIVDDASSWTQDMQDATRRIEQLDPRRPRERK